MGNDVNSLNTAGRLASTANASPYRYEPLQAVRGVIEVGRLDRVLERTIRDVAWNTDCSVTIDIDRHGFRKTVRFCLAEYRAGQAKKARDLLSKLGILSEVGQR